MRRMAKPKKSRHATGISLMSAIFFSAWLLAGLLGCTACQTTADAKTGAGGPSDIQATTASAPPSSAVSAATATPTPTAMPTPTRKPTPTPMPSATPAPTPTPKPTPAPTLTPKPSATPKPAGTVTEGVTYYRGFADPRTITPQPVADPASLTALVNKYYALPPDYVPPLVAVAGTAFKMHPAAHEAWTAMKEDLKQTIGVEIIMLSAYRSYSAQAASFRNALERKGVAGTVPYNALEGRSEHQLGLAVDVNDDQCEPHRLKFANTPTYAWLSAHAHEYGFILRYPAGKEAITGYANEPWHYRFVGTEAAGIIHANNWTLEEYLGLAG